MHFLASLIMNELFTKMYDLYLLSYIAHRSFFSYRRSRCEELDPRVQDPNYKDGI